MLRTPVWGMSASVAGELREEWSTESHPNLKIYAAPQGVWLVWPVNAINMYDVNGVYNKVRFIPRENIAAFIPENDEVPAFMR